MFKTIKQVIRRPSPHWVGDGFNVYPVFADKAFTNELSPFLMFDYAAPKKFAPLAGSRRRGVGQHPHRGFETVTIAFQGEVEHADSQGNSGVIGPGDVQWMTAARGIVHEEYHSTEFSQRGGVLEMCQLWVNLPAADKMSPPRYQPILERDIPVAPLVAWDDAAQACASDPSDPAEGGVRVIAGECRGTRGPAATFTQVDMWDVIINEVGRTYELPTVPGNNVVVFVRRGAIEVQGEELGPQDTAILEREGTTLLVKALAENTSALILAGEPIDEPIAARGPFVMNTQEEIMQANADYRSGRLAEHF